MNYLLMGAGLLSLMTGIVHSLLGEFLVFKQLRGKSIVPTNSAPPLRQSNVRILWATWHLASVFGFAIGAVLIHLAQASNYSAFIVQTVAISMLVSSALVCFATKARHPGWIALLGVAVLCFLA